MMCMGDPTDKNGISYASLSSYRKNGWYQEVKEKNPKAILAINYENSEYSDYSSYGYNPQFGYNYGIMRNTPPYIDINEPLANKLLESTGKTIKQIRYEIEKSGKPQSVEIKVPFCISAEWKYEPSNSCNVIGFIEGRDLKDEYLIVSAHYDHEGKYGTEVYNGADDNASGVSAVLEIARVFSEAKKAGQGPRKSIIFLFPTGEEMGLWGSMYYSEHPIFPLEKTVACINLDMLGRVSEEYLDKTSNYVYLVSDTKKSGTLVQSLKTINDISTKLIIDTKFTSPDDSNRYFERSDQYNFAEKNIPSIMLTSGEHKDYHRATDDTEFINFSALKKRTELAFMLIWQLANEK